MAWPSERPEQPTWPFVRWLRLLKVLISMGNRAIVQPGRFSHVPV